MAVDKSVVMFAVSILVSGCAVMSALGFRGRVSVVGIDLGTTYSVVAVSEMGKARVMRDEQGEALVASTVAFLRGGDVAVGDDAKRHKNTDARHVIFDAKRFIGRAFDDPTVADQAEGYSFAVMKNESTGGVAFALDPALGHGAAVTPSEIENQVGAHVLRRLMGTVERSLGHSNVKRAVIAVPASFNARQTKETADAFKLAGLSIARVMPEPVAAAVAYGLQRKPDVHHILVFDFGGGTLDVSVLYVNTGSIEVVANGGDNDLGGTDFDSCIEHELATQVAAASEDSSEETCAQSCAAHVLAQLSEEMKIELSAASTARRSCCDGRIPLEMTQESFFVACDHLFQRASTVVVDTLLESNLSTKDIDEVVTVGGTTRMPKIRDDLRRTLGVTRLNSDIDPDITVAMGAASILD